MSKHVNEDLFNQASIGMDPEQIEKYKMMGEIAFKNVDFDSPEPYRQSQSDTLSESIAYINEGLKSGLHPSCLTEDEVKVMESWGGEKWFERYGYDSV